MTAGLPGMGLGGLFYVLLGGWMLLREGGRMCLGHGDRRALGAALKHAGLAVSMAVALWGSAQAVRLGLSLLNGRAPNNPAFHAQAAWDAGLAATLGVALCILGGLLLTLHVLPRCLPRVPRRRNEGTRGLCSTGPGRVHTAGDSTSRADVPETYAATGRSPKDYLRQC